MPSLASMSAASASIVKDDKNQGEKMPPGGKLNSGEANPERDAKVIEILQGQGKTEFFSADDQPTGSQISRR